MRKLIYFFIFIFSLSFALAQMPPSSKPDAELTEEEAGLRIEDWQAKVDNLQSILDKVNTDISGMKKSMDEAKKNLKDCQDAVHSMVGANDADIDAFRQKLGVLEGKVRQMKKLSNDQLADRRSEVEALETQLNALRKNKISLIPEFFNKILTIAKDIKGLYREKKIHSYTVGTWAEDRDCLWNISGKMEIYGDPFQWPKIWQANKNIVRNPDIIHPGQVLTLPAKGPKTSEELKAERRYWREKRETMNADAQVGGDDTTGGN